MSERKWLWSILGGQFLILLGTVVAAAYSLLLGFTIAGCTYALGCAASCLYGGLSAIEDITPPAVSS